MEVFFLAAAITVGIAIILTLYRTVYGPGEWNRLAGLNVVGTKAVVLMVLIGFIFGRPSLFVDIALLYGLLNFMVVLFIAIYLVRKQKA
ncbi:monovalent cation/H+ antiporter complex subunit F [Thermodesulfovibrionales bacterium]|nr:monovalent cation/H+ antiporter complex subunit F [Thermodesulfovibrionales bacterium]